MTIWRFWISDCKYYLFKYLLLTVQIHNFLLLHSSNIILRLSRDSSRAWMDGKTNDIIFTLKAEAHDYSKERCISDMPLRCSANHNALGQLANQSRLCLSEGGSL